MKAHRLTALLAAIPFVMLISLPPAAGQEASTAKKADAKAAKPPAKKKFPEWDKVLEGTKQLEGLFKLHHNEKEQKLFLELGQGQYDKEMLLAISIARGAGLRYLGGNTLNFGNQWVLSFRRAADRILVVRRNVYFRAKKGTPLADAVNVSYTDSVIAALPIKSEQGGGSRVLVDLADLFMTDLARVGVTPDRRRSTWAKVKTFENNVEIEVSAVFSGRSFGLFDDGAIPDPRGTQVVFHYGLSMLPAAGGYKPREADDRVGHFLSVVKDFSTDVGDTAFVRYVTRWQLEKDDPAADKSPPKRPIVFWIEKTVPRQYRPYVRSGIEEWNKAFERIGFINAIEVRQQRDSDEFDPEDTNYNTFRWITTSRGFAMGPSRTNPKTGQIFDADIVFDEAMVRYWRQEYLRTLGVPEGLELLRRGDRQAWFKLHVAELPWILPAEPEISRILRDPKEYEQMLAQAAPGMSQPGASMLPGYENESCMLGPGMKRQLGLLAAMLAAKGAVEPGGKVPDEFIGQAIKEVVMHEVGHTLGLRHNFKASTMLTLKEIHDPEKTRKTGLAGSVMDYLPANFAPKGEDQGEYFTSTLGPYDYWAIEYAYKPISGDEKAELAKIAGRVAEPELGYATDEDLYFNPDPMVNLWDLGDPLDYSQQRFRLVAGYMDDLADRVVAKGEGWQRARDAFSTMLTELALATYLSAQYVGAEYTHRDHRDDPNARPPFKPVARAKQREAIAFLKEHVLSGNAFRFPPELVQRLAPRYWMHWGMSRYMRSYQYPMHEQILSIQRIVLSRFLDPSVLQTLQNIELRAAEGEEVLQMPEVFDALTDAIWSELPEADKDEDAVKVEISTVRRNLQREHFRRLSQLVLGPRRGALSLFDLLSGAGSEAPADARSLARLHLRSIDARISQVLDREDSEIDSYSRAHLEELHDHIGKVLEASLQVSEP